MKRYVDLHIHSTHSDGSWTPSEIVARAARYELAVISITDHDAVSGNQEAKEEAEKYGIEFIPGIEISTKWCEGRLHILGYFIDYGSSEIIAFLRALQDERRKRIFRMCKRLAEINMPVDPELVFQIAGNTESPGRPHIANAMVKLGYVPTLQSAFDRYLAYGKPAYVSRWSPEPKDAIEVIHKIGGIAVLAHCPVTEGCMKQFDKVLKLGIDGVEVYYPTHKPDETKHLKAVAKRYGLAITGGSDCHGMTRGEPLLGIYKVPYEVYENLVKFYEKFLQHSKRE